MAISVGGDKTRPTPQMNVTPLVDVVLVLLIIFMVVTPLLAKQFWLELPKLDESQRAQPSKARGPLLVKVDQAGNITLNKAPVPLDRLEAEVRAAMADRRTVEAVFFEAANELPYSTAVSVLDATRAGGGRNIAVVTRAP